jgi:hypothetical protein
MLKVPEPCLPTRHARLARHPFKLTESRSQRQRQPGSRRCPRLMEVLSLTALSSPANIVLRQLGVVQMVTVEIVSEIFEGIARRLPDESEPLPAGAGSIALGM